MFLVLLVLPTLFTGEIRTEHGGYSAIVGEMPVDGGKIGYFAYEKEGTGRPITFVFNGGPGSSSIWLHMGMFGPRRVRSPEEGQSSLPPYEIVDNEAGLLDLSDLVFIDPVGTGRGTDVGEKANEYYAVKKDYESVGNFIRNYLTIKGRWNSPKYIAGESYGSCRACELTNWLQDEGIAIHGLILISPALDFQAYIPTGGNLLPYMLEVPTYAATARHYLRCYPERTLDEVVQMARSFIYERYPKLLFCPTCLTEEEQEAIFAEISTLSGISLDIVRKKNGLIDLETFLTEFMEGKALGSYDTRTDGRYGEVSRVIYHDDQSILPITKIFTGAFQQYLSNELQCPENYCTLSIEVNHNWNFGQEQFGYPNFLPTLRRSILTHPELKVFFASGYFDAITTFEASHYFINQLRLPDPSNVQFHSYYGGHMYYLNPDARLEFKKDLVEFYRQ